MLAGVIQAVASSAWFATVSHPARPKGWDITWGAQVDPRVVRLTGDGEITDVAVASYLAKYATKSTEPVGVPPGRITTENARTYATPRTHQGRLIAACLKLGNHPHEDFQALSRWTHMLGYRGHFLTKCHPYSVSSPSCARTASPTAALGIPRARTPWAAPRAHRLHRRLSGNTPEPATPPPPSENSLSPPPHEHASTTASPERRPG